MVFTLWTTTTVKEKARMNFCIDDLFSSFAADHNWRMDSLQKHSAATVAVGVNENYVKLLDERGHMNLYSNKKFVGSSSVVFEDSFGRSSTKEYAWTTSSLPNDCIGDPDKCREGLSVSFWFKGMNFYLGTPGDRAPKDIHFCIQGSRV